MAKRQPRLLILQVCLIIILSLFANTVMTLPQNSCPEGTFTFYSKGRATCVPCPEGTYNPWKHNGKTNCFPCTKIRDPVVEISVSECNGIYDADIRCKDDFFRYLDQYHLDGPKCMNCTLCQDGYVKSRPCESFRNTVCCRDTNGNQIYDDRDAEYCSGMRRLIKCYRGKYYDTASNECRPCPNNTFMSEDHHFKPKCKPCDSAKTTDLPENVILKQGCTSTRPHEYGCKTGFYGKSFHRYSPENFRCYPCQKCLAETHAERPCDMYHDTVCCDEPNMVVVDVPEGGLCIRQNAMVMEIHPAVSHGIRLQEGDCQSVQCFIALPNWPEGITWTLPSANRTLDGSWSTHKTINGNIVITTSIITICNVTPEDEGKLICQAKVDGNDGPMSSTNIGPACKSGTYNPPNCDRNCSHNCKAPIASGGSDLLLCDDISGACLSGCVNGYTGDLCTDSKEKVKEEIDNGTTTAGAIGIGFGLGLILILVIILVCYAYMKRNPESCVKWCRQILDPVNQQMKELEDRKSALEEENEKLKIEDQGVKGQNVTQNSEDQKLEEVIGKHKLDIENLHRENGKQKSKIEKHGEMGSDKASFCRRTGVVEDVELQNKAVDGSEDSYRGDLQVNIRKPKGVSEDSYRGDMQVNVWKPKEN